MKYETPEVVDFHPDGPSYGIKLVGIGRIGGRAIDPPEWVVSFDPDDGDPDVAYPTGVVESNVNPAMAIGFATAADAVKYARQQSTRTPLRPDGLPNRPMTVFTVVIEALPK